MGDESQGSANKKTGYLTREEVDYLLAQVSDQEPMSEPEEVFRHEEFQFLYFIDAATKDYIREVLKESADSISNEAAKRQRKAVFRELSELRKPNLNECLLHIKLDPNRKFSDPDCEKTFYNENIVYVFSDFSEIKVNFEFEAASLLYFDRYCRSLVKDTIEGMKSLKPESDKVTGQVVQPEVIQFHYLIVHPDRKKMLDIISSMKSIWENYAHLNQVKVEFIEVDELVKQKNHQCLIRLSHIGAGPTLKVYDLLPRQKDICFANEVQLKKFELDQVELAGKFLILDLLLTS